MKNKWRKWGCLILAFTIMLVANGCNEKGEIVQKEVPSVPMLELPQKESISDTQNLLTGIEDLSTEAIGKRPVAVMINNVEDALPQYGIAEADIVFEIPVEGNLTRLMAIYGDYTTLPDICAIRSCRYYYPAIAKGFDAYYVHWGSDPTIVNYVSSLNMDCYDGMANPYNLFGRDQSRLNSGYALEHTGYFKGTAFAETVQSAGVRTDLLEEKKGTAFQFPDYGETVTPTGGGCNRVNIKFGATTSTFHYDAANQVYTKQMNGHDHIDGNTGEALKFKNVFVLETSISVRDEVGHKKLDWAGSANSVGYYISNGAIEKIHWSKANNDESEYLRFYKESGEELILNRGKIYIAYTSAGKMSYE